MTKQDWTKNLKSKLSDYQAPVPEGLWDDIEASLPQASPERRVSMIPWRKWSVAAAMALALLGGGTYLWQRYGMGNPETLASADKQGHTAEVVDNNDRTMVADDMPEVENDVVVQDDTRMSSTPTPTASRVNPSSGVSRPVVTQQPATPVSSSSQDAPSLIAQADVKTETGRHLETDGQTETDCQPEAGHQPEVGVTTPTPQPQQGNVGYLPTTWEMPVGSARKGNSPFTFGLFASNDALSFSGSEPVIDYAMANIGMFELGDANSMSYLRLPGYEEKTRHHRPISMGLSAQFGLAKRLALTTGVVYSNLKSDYIYEMGGTTLERNQVLHYVGVPVEVVYTVWSKYGLSAYATAGAQADFCVKATLKSEGVKKSIDKDRVQFSTLVGVGVQYNFVPSVGIYVEPTLKYYFDNGSDVENAFKDRPTNIGFQFGLRYNIDK